MPDLREQLLAELVDLRQDVGLTPARIHQQPVLLERLGKRTAREAAQQLVTLVRLIGAPLQRKAVEWSFRLTGTKGNTLTARWDDLRKDLKKEEKRNYSVQTVRRLTDKGFDDLVRLILEYSPEGSGEISASQRIADLELTVSMMGRIIYSLMNQLPAGQQERIDESIRADLESYEVSLAKVVWRGSDNGKEAVPMFSNRVYKKLDDDEINPLEMLNYLRAPVIEPDEPGDSDPLDQVDSTEAPKGNQ
jgi:hypothetical protein